MNLIEFFYQPGNPACMKTLAMLHHVTERRSDVILVTAEVDTKAGRKRAAKYSVKNIPHTVINGEHTITGVPQSFEQILRPIRWR